MMRNQIGFLAPGHARASLLRRTSPLGVNDTHLGCIVVYEDASQLLVGRWFWVGGVGWRLGASSLRCVAPRADQT